MERREKDSEKPNKTKRVRRIKMPGDEAVKIGDQSKSLYSYEAQKTNTSSQMYKYPNNQKQRSHSKVNDNYKGKSKFLSLQNVGYLSSEAAICNSSLGAVTKKNFAQTNNVEFLPNSVNTYQRKDYQKTSSSKNGPRLFDVDKLNHELEELKLKDRHFDAQGLKHDVSTKKLERKTHSTDCSSFSVECSINLTWIRRFCSGTGFITFENHSQFMTARVALGQTISILDEEVSIRISKTSKDQLFLVNIPSVAVVEDLKEAFEINLPDIKPANIELRFEPSYETTDDEVDKIKKQIELKCADLTGLGEYQLLVPKPKASSTIMKAYINIPNNKNLDVAAKHLSATSVMIDRNEKFVKIKARPVYRSLIKCSLSICKAIDDRLKLELCKLESESRKKYLDDIFSVQINSTDATTAAIKLLTNYNDIMKKLHSIINELLEGEILNENNLKNLPKFFYDYNLKWLNSMSREKSVLALADNKVKTIRLYGLHENCVKVKKQIETFLNEKYPNF